MRDPLLANTPYEFYTFWDNLWHHSFAHFLTDPPTIPCVNRVMRVTCQRVADAHRLWGATSSPTKFHLSSCHASSFCNNLASLALQLMEREPIIQHFGVWVEIQLEAQHPQLRYLAPSQIWGLRSLSLLLEGGWALGQCRQLYLHLLINSAILELTSDQVKAVVVYRLIVAALRSAFVCLRMHNTCCKSHLANCTLAKRCHMWLF